MNRIGRKEWLNKNKLICAYILLTTEIKASMNVYGRLWACMTVRMKTK